MSRSTTSRSMGVQRRSQAAKLETAGSWRRSTDRRSIGHTDHISAVVPSRIRLRQPFLDIPHYVAEILCNGRDWRLRRGSAHLCEEPIKLGPIEHSIGSIGANCGSEHACVAILEKPARLVLQIHEVRSLGLLAPFLDNPDRSSHQLPVNNHFGNPGYMDLSIPAGLVTTVYQLVGDPEPASRPIGLPALVNLN